MQLKTTLLAAAIVVAGLAVQPFDVAHAATSTADMPVQIVIQNACDVSTVAPTTLDFGTAGPLTAAVDNTSTITVTCTTGADYNVGLGGGGSGDTSARVMKNGTDTVSYQLYSDSGHNTAWGDNVGTDTVTSTGTGTQQTFTVYGEVPAQTTPPAGTYTDTVAVTVTY